MTKPQRQRTKHVPERKDNNKNQDRNKTQKKIQKESTAAATIAITTDNNKYKYPFFVWMTGLTNCFIKL